MTTAHLTSDFNAGIREEKCIFKRMSTEKHHVVVPFFDAIVTLSQCRSGIYLAVVLSRLESFSDRRNFQVIFQSYVRILRLHTTYQREELTNCCSFPALTGIYTLFT